MVVMVAVVGSFVCCSVVILFAYVVLLLCDNRDLQGCCVVLCGSAGNNKVVRWCGGVGVVYRAVVVLWTVWYLVGWVVDKGVVVGK